MQRKINTFSQIWGIPILLGVFTIAGLILAIDGNDFLRYVSWVLLIVPVYLCIKYGRKGLKKHKVKQVI